MTTKSCDLCRHNARTQTGPHAWRHDCGLRQRDYPDASQCGAYEPPPFPIQTRESSGLGPVWDGEWDGTP